jgi:hypothetical protein
VDIYNIFRSKHLLGGDQKSEKSRLTIYGFVISKSRTITEAYERIGYMQHDLLWSHLINEEEKERPTVLLV